MVVLYVVDVADTLIKGPAIFTSMTDLFTKSAPLPMLCLA